MTERRVLSDIEDNYPEYVRETLGYTYNVWDVVPSSARKEHDRILHLEASELPAQIMASLPDIARWALARRLRDTGDAYGFLKIAQELGEKSNSELGLSAHDIGIAGALTACTDAPELTPVFIAIVGDHSPMSGFLKAASALMSAPEEATQLFEEWCKDDPEAHFDVAHYLCERGLPDEGRKWLERTRDVSHRTQKKSVLLDVALLEESLNNE